MFAMTGISVLPLNCTSNTAASDSVTGLGSTNARLTPVQNHSHKNSKLLYKGISQEAKKYLLSSFRMITVAVSRFAPVVLLTKSREKSSSCSRVSSLNISSTTIWSVFSGAKVTDSESNGRKSSFSAR